MDRTIFHRIPMVAVMMLLAAGCAQQGPTRHSLSGNINYDGKPVPAGEISFEPDASRGNKGPSAVATITAGKYETAPNFGVVGGPHRARIRGFDGIPVQLPGETPILQGTPLFEEHVIAIDLPEAATRHDFDLPAVSSNRVPK